MSSSDTSRAIDARDDEIHAFNLVLADQAREQAAAIDEMAALGPTRARSPACRWR